MKFYNTSMNMKNYGHSQTSHLKHLSKQSLINTFNLSSKMKNLNKIYRIFLNKFKHHRPKLKIPSENRFFRGLNHCFVCIL